MTTVPSQVGAYTIEREIGRGGMGVVYRGHDTKLDRPVAIKALPEHLAQDPERLVRFEREARTLAQLSHSNVAGIFGIEEANGGKYLVLEYVEGETLAERLDRGALELNEALDVCTQIAAGVEAAHEAGVIHRDLKPANIKITPDGMAKVLDFGLAKAEEGASSTGSGMSQSPTLTSPAIQHSPTIPGAILGTAAYMSPEQARGRRVDKRTDIWSFGVVLYECLVGASPFAGETVSDSIGAILHKEVDLDCLPVDTPPMVRQILRRCLERDRSKRLRDVGDARIVIEEIRAGAADAPDAAPITHGERPLLPWVIAGAGVATAVVVLAVGGFRSVPPQSDQLTRTSVLTPIAVQPDLTPGNFALSPDGGAIVFLASDSTGSRLFVRELAETEARPLTGTEGAWFPFWSADSRHLGFFAGGALRRVPRGGGPVQTICAAEDGRGGAWNRDGMIVFAADFQNAPLLRVSASGGTPTPATSLDKERGEVSHRFPSFLPDGRHFTFGIEPRSAAGRIRIKVASLDEVTTGKPLLEASAAPRFADPNYLVFQRDGALMAQSIDLEHLEMVGDAQILDERPSLQQVVTSTPIAHVSANGKMLYTPVDPRSTAFVWLDRNGRRTETGIRKDGLLSFPSVSHRGDRAVVTRTTSGNVQEGSIWIFDLELGEGLQVTARDQSAYAAVWSSDDRDLATLLSPGGRFDPVWIAADSGAIREILAPELRWTHPVDVSADGSVLLYDDQTPGMRQNLGYLRLDGGAPERTEYLTTPAAEMGGRLSPDGAYIAYLSDSSGTNEVYADTFPTPSRTRRVTTGGEAIQVEFSSDGAELLILAADGDRASLFACDFASADGLTIGRPQKLFTLPAEWSGFAPAPDGQRFLLLEPVGNRSPSLTLVGNWHAQLAPQR